MIRLYLHLGYPKTGTSSLQHAFFDALYRDGQIHYLGMFGFARDATADRKSFFSELTRVLYLEDEKDFALVLPDLQAAFWRLCDGVDQPVVLSNEHFVQSQWSTTKPGQRILPARSAARLAQVFEGAEVSLMLAIRRQDVLLRSMFLEHASRPSHANPTAYRSLQEYLDICLDPADFHGAFYNFDDVVDGYRNAFPKAPLLTWTFEAFRDRQLEVLGQITAFLGLDDNVPSCVSLPLAHHNAKSKGGATVNVKLWSPLHKLIQAMPGGEALARAARRSLLLVKVNEALKSRVPVPALTSNEAEAILSRWEVSNTRLIDRFPDLAEELRAEGYVPALRVVNV